jgi:hypothetical protein
MAGGSLSGLLDVRTVLLTRLPMARDGSQARDDRKQLHDKIMQSGK